MIKKFFFGIAVTIALLNTNANAGSSKMIDVFKNNPVFSLQISAVGCGAYEFRINDAPIYGDLNGVPIDTTFPIDEWMISGNNSMSIIVAPESANDAQISIQSGQQCVVSATLQVRPNGTPESENMLISTLKYSAIPNNLTTLEANLIGSTPVGKYNSSESFKQDNKDGDVTLDKITITSQDTKNGSGVIITRQLQLPQLPFPKWTWLNGEILSDNDATREDLYKQYQNIFDAIKSNNLKPLAPLFQIKKDESAAAYYSTPDQFDQFAALAGDASNNQMQFGGVVPYKYTKLKVFGNGKLAKLVASWDGGTLIFFNYKDGSANVSYDLTFSKINGKWVIVR